MGWQAVTPLQAYNIVAALTDQCEPLPPPRPSVTTPPANASAASQWAGSAKNASPAVPAPAVASSTELGADATRLEALGQVLGVPGPWPGCMSASVYLDGLRAQVPGVDDGAALLCLDEVRPSSTYPRFST